MIAGRGRNSSACPSLRALRNLRYALPLLVLLAVLAGCRKDQLFTDAVGVELEFSENVILFDTVFTTVGTVTKRFTARNPGREGVRVDIRLEGGSASPFRINVDGSPGLSFSQVEIPGGDSLYIFVEATLGEGGVNTPFVIEDHILFSTGSGGQQVTLNAWGQDAHFFRADEYIPGFPPFSYIAGGYDAGGNQICETVHWVNDKPYVIYGYGVVDSCCTLIIDPGVKVYMHGSAGLWVYRGGRIQANGTADERITFQGDRLEAMYADLPGQWDRIWINDGPADNVLNHVEIKNALIGIQAQSWIGTPGQPTSANTLVLNNVDIRNCSAAGILSENYRIRSTNLLVGDCGQYGVALTGGGQYHFNHSTIANYWSYDVRQEPAFILTNTFTDIYGNGQVRDVEESLFRNGIIHGNNTNEFELAFDNQLTPDIFFKNFLFRTNKATNDPVRFEQASIYRNQDPGFENVNERDLHLKGSSGFRDKGYDPPNGNPDHDPEANWDLDGQARFSSNSALGCYTADN